jgi:hypothetical protein
VTKEQSQTIKNEIDAITKAEKNGFLRLLEDPMGQAIFASISTISCFGFVLSGIWLVDAIVN